LGDVEATVKKSAFFDLFSRHRGNDLDDYLRTHIEGEDYIVWNGYVIPNDFGDAESEYRALRNCCAMFDVTPIRKYRIHGRDAGVFLDHLLTRPVTASPVMRGIYVVFCNEEGILKDDAILYKFAEDDYLLMPSEMDHAAHFESLRQKLGLDDVSIEDRKESLAGVSLQGPVSATVLHRWGFKGIEQLEPFEVRDYPLGDGNIRISRMGFTADLGYECWFDPKRYEAFETGLLSVSESMGIDIPGYGITVMEACRIEGGFVVPGWDCATERDRSPGFERTPYELNLGWLVELNQVDFVGRDALCERKKDGHRFALRGFVIETRTKATQGATLHAMIDGEVVEIGTMPCISYSWGMERTIGNASIQLPYADLKEAWTIIDGERLGVELKCGPLINLPRRTQLPAPLHENIERP
jgi:aminomethyltransferase